MSQNMSQNMIMDKISELPEELEMKIWKYHHRL